MYLSVFSCVMFFDSSGDIQSKNQEKWFSFVAISYSRKYQRSLILEILAHNLLRQEFIET